MAVSKTTTERAPAALINTYRAAELLGVVQSTIAARIRAGEIPAIEVEGGGGRMTLMVRAGDLRRLRNRMIEELRQKDNPSARMREDHLVKTVI